jgi:hypothetical protein
MPSKRLVIKTLTLSLIFLANFAYSQSNFYKLSLGIGGGPNYSFTDVKKGKFGSTIYGTFDYNFTPFVTGGIEFQTGVIKGGSRTEDLHNREFTNEYSSVTANFKLMLGELVNYDRNDFLYSLRGLYAGVGVGIINNNMTDIVRYKPLNAAIDPGYGPFPGADKSTDISIPINLGINFFIEDNYGDQRFVINLNAQSNVTVGEGLDGYNDPPAKFKNTAPDIYNTYTIGVKYFFGPSRVYRKNL